MAPSVRPQPVLFADPRTRRKVQMQEQGKGRYSGASLVASNLLLVVSLTGAKTWILGRQLNELPLAVTELSIAAGIVLVTAAVHGRASFDFLSEAPAVAVASVLQLLQHTALFFALNRISLVRVLGFTQFSTLWLSSVSSPSSTRRALASLSAFVISVVIDISSNEQTPGDTMIAHAALLVHAVVSTGLSYAQASIIPKLGRHSTHCATLSGAAVIGLVIVAVMKVMALPLGPPETTSLLEYTPIPLFACLFAIFSPIVATQLGLAPPTIQSFTTSIASATVFAYVFSGIIRGLGFHWLDIAVIACVAYGSFPSSLAPAKSTNTAQLAQSYLKIIIANPESRRIFYFLMLNLCFMLVQMLYGVWTNSLGLISDAIHMAFDCMAIAMGLFASVMATWTPNEKYTYGYGRIETLSGFANGIFLLLISVFIVFEAIQRLLDPPEMNTNQLLLVSTMGLAVNLFGMFAMGGHHHHGHGHGHHHGHSHGDDHGHSHSHVHDHGHSDAHSHSHASAHVHSHSHTHSHSHSRSHSHSHPRSHSHSHSPSHTHELPRLHVHDPAHAHEHDHEDGQEPQHEHGHEHEHEHEHGHEHEHEHGHDHDHGHDHEHEHMHLERSHIHTALCEHDHAHLEDDHHLEHHHQHGNGVVANGHLHDHASQELQELMPSMSVTSPLTPSYKFGETDSHFATHHAHGPHAPNTHAHDHKHQMDDAHAHESHSHNMRGVFLHVMADTLGSVGVIVSTILIQLYGWTGFDPIASIFIAVMIAASVFPLVLDTARVLSLDVGTERETVVRSALGELKHVDGVAGYSAPRFWPKDAETLIGAIHIHVARTPDGSGYTGVDRVMARVDELLRERIPGLEELTIQVMAGT